MRKTMNITFGILLTLAVGCLQAQEGQRQRRQPPSPEEVLEKATTALNLTNEQVEAWQEVHETYAEEMQEDPRKTLPKVEAAIKEILTEEQWAEFEQMKPRKGPRGRGK